MTRSRGVLTVILALTIALEFPSSYAGNAVPVLLWGGSTNSNSESSAVNPFQKTSRSEFEEILGTRLGKSQPPILVLLLDNLCVEDFTQHKEQLQRTTKDGSLAYLPAVETPLSVFKDLSSYNQTYDDDDEADSVSDGQLLIKSISNLDIFDTYKAIKDSSPNLIAALTGNSCGYRKFERVRRDTPAAPDTTAFKINSERVLFYATAAPMLKISNNGEFIPLPNPVVPPTDRGAGTKEAPLFLRMQFGGKDDTMDKFSLEFEFNVTTIGYYTLKTVNYKEKDINNNLLTTTTDINFPFNFSYHCAREIIFQKGDVSLKMLDMQVQIDPKGTEDFKYFDDAYDCIGFTSIPIWAGIFVTAILGVILIWALTMIIDIRTMDRFDDPKGKTITISALE